RYKQCQVAHTCVPASQVEGNAFAQGSFDSAIDFKGIVFVFQQYIWSQELILTRQTFQRSLFQPAANADVRDENIVEHGILHFSERVDVCTCFVIRIDRKVEPNSSLEFIVPQEGMKLWFQTDDGIGSYNSGIHYRQGIAFQSVFITVVQNAQPQCVEVFIEL